VFFDSKLFVRRIKMKKFVVITLICGLAVGLAITSWSGVNPGPDVNGDGQVDIVDLMLVSEHFGVTNPEVGDVNGDGTVDISDLVLVGVHLGKMYTGVGGNDTQVIWTNTGVVVYKYVALSGTLPFDAPATFTNEGGSGNVEFTATSGKKTITDTFYVESGKSYKLTIKGSVWNPNCSGIGTLGSENYPLVVTSPNASGSWSASVSVNYCFPSGKPSPPFLSSMEIKEIIPLDPNWATLSIVSLDPPENSHLSIGDKITAIVNYAINVPDFNLDLSVNNILSMMALNDKSADGRIHVYRQLDKKGYPSRDHPPTVG
jgi:hypothetical protein